MANLARVRAGLAEGRRTGALHVLIAGLGVTLALLIGFAGHVGGASYFVDERWNAHRDRSLIELLGYAFLVVAAVLMLMLFVRRKASVYAGWAAGLIVLVADDALRLHERAGQWLDRNYEGAALPLLRVADLGELAFWAVTGAAVSAVLLVTHRRSPRGAQAHSYRLAALVALLMVFAVGVDMLHIAVQGLLGSHKVDIVLISIEAAGEAGAMAGLVAYAIHITRRSVDRAPGPPDDVLYPHPDQPGPASRPSATTAVD